MKVMLRKAAHITALAVAALAVQLTGVSAQGADNYPSQTIRFVCAFPAGSGADVLVRYFAEKVSKVAGATIIVENRPGAASNIAAEYTARSKPDGHTIFVHSGNSIAGNMHILKKPPINVVTDLQTVATTHSQPFMITVGYNSPIKSLRELTEVLKQKGAKGSYAVNATSGMVLAESYKQKAGLETLQVRYGSSGESLNDLTSGALDFGAHDPAFSLAQLRNKRLRILAVGMAQRMQAAPDIPTMAEQGVAIDQVGWWGAMVAKGTPKPIIDKINGWFNEVLKTEDAKQFLVEQGGDVFISTPEEAQALMAKTVDEWKELVAIAKIPQQ
jgi:tripartite-type tricarboxylate transporter receptor subunit TctC